MVTYIDSESESVMISLSKLNGSIDRFKELALSAGVTESLAGVFHSALLKMAKDSSLVVQDHLDRYGEESLPNPMGEWVAVQDRINEAIQKYLSNEGEIPELLESLLGIPDEFAEELLRGVQASQQVELILLSALYQ